MKINLITSAHFDSLASSAAEDATKKMSSVASASSAAIKEIAEKIFQTDGSINVITTMEEPNDNLYWFYIEDTEEVSASRDITIVESNVEPARNSSYWFYIEDTEED